jgi:hypothetical protein
MRLENQQVDREFDSKSRYNLELRRRDREAEGAPLLREYAVMSCIKGSNPFVSAIKQPPKGGFLLVE